MPKLNANKKKEKVYIAKYTIANNKIADNHTKFTNVKIYNMDVS